MSHKSLILSLKFKNKIGYIILAMIEFIVALDYTRGGVIYATDSTTFVYHYPCLSYHYLEMALYSYYPWYTLSPSFNIATFIINIIPYIFSNLPLLSDTIFMFTLMYIGSAFTYKLVYDILSSNFHMKGYALNISSNLAAIFYVVNPQNLVNSTFTDISTGTYIYVLLPVLIYGIRSILTNTDLRSFISWYLLAIAIALIEYYLVFPTYILMFLITFTSIIIYYSLISIRSKKFLRLFLIFIPIVIFIGIKINSILDTYNETVFSEEFVKGSYLFWVDNSEMAPLFETLRGLIYAIKLPYYSYIFSFAFPIFYMLPIVLKRTRSEVVFYIVMFLITSFLYSMPNVPLSAFFKSLFFKFPVLADLRTQYVLVGPFESLFLSIVMGFGLFYFINLFSDRSLSKKLVALILAVLVVIIPPFNVLSYGLNHVYGFPITVDIPRNFLEVSNYINNNSFQNSSVWILPISATENGETWYQGQNLFNLFLKDRVILGGGYYSYNQEERKIIYNAEMIIGYSNFTPSNLLYLYNYLYLFNIHYIILEKDYNYKAYPVEICLTISQLIQGLTNYTKFNITKEILNNTLYSVYGSEIESSFAFVSNYNITSNISIILHHENLSTLLISENLIENNQPEKYIIYINPQFINMTVYLYLMLPFSLHIDLIGAQILQKSVFLGDYILLKVHVYSHKLVLIYSKYNRSFINGMLHLLIQIILPTLLGILINIRLFNIIKFKIPKIILKHF